jgi:putative tryptophan/tyrosine transport system substrate-binding protein
MAGRRNSAEGMRRIAVLLGWSESDLYRSWIATLAEELARLGWVDGRNVQMDVRWARGDVRRMQTFAKELVELQPDLILASTTPVTAALQRETRTLPIVFVVVVDPVGSGFVASLSRPGGNITGFINVEPEMGGKWLEILKQIAPRMSRVAMMFNPDTAPGGGAFFLNPFEAAARSMAVEPITVRVRSDAEIEAGIASLGREQAGLVLQSDSFLAVHQGTLISLAARNNVPAIGADIPGFTRAGGLLSYGANFLDFFRRAASYVDRVLARSEPERPSGAGADQVRVGDQSKDGARARHRSAVSGPLHRRRGDRIDLSHASICGREVT